MTPAQEECYSHLAATHGSTFQEFERPSGFSLAGFRIVLFLPMGVRLELAILALIPGFGNVA
jgi:hypothetical protein